MTPGPTATAPARSPGGLVARTRRVDDPGDLLDHLGSPGFAWLTGPAGFVTAGVAARIPVGPGPDRFERAAAAVAAVLGSVIADGPVAGPGRGPRAVGALPFDDANPGELVVPEVITGRDPSGEVWVTEIGPGARPRRGPGGEGAGPGGAAPGIGSDPPAGIGDGNGRRPGPLAIEERTDPRQWTAAVREVLSAIDRGEIRKVVLARELLVEAAASIDRHLLLARLRSLYPSCFVYAAGGFVGATPELLVARAGREVRSCPMAGTVRRSPDPGEDDRLVSTLRRSAKDAQEHALLVEAVLEALAPVCAGRLRAAPSGVIRLATVSHLATEVSGRLAEPAPSALALAGRLHPTPAVGGLPRAAALATIGRLEGFDRGLYAGPVGWVDAAGDGEWAVALRGAELDGRRARLVAGAGIVAGSDAEAEWDETAAKLQAMLGVFGWNGAPLRD